MRKPQYKIKNESLAKRTRRKLSIRKTVVGTADKPRVCMTKSNKHLRVQIIDDSKGVTIDSVQTYGKSAVAGASKNREGAAKLGAALAEKMKAKKLETGVFDRSGNVYCGVLASFTDSLRENGIKI